MAQATQFDISNHGAGVRTRLFDDNPLPLVIEPDAPDTDLAQWAEGKKDWIDQALLHHGAILFRGFSLEGTEDLRHFGGKLINEWMPYVDRASKRHAVDGPVQTSTDTPSRFEIPLHCESSFTSRWPMRLFFMCLKASKSGGCTPLASVRGVYNRIENELLERFEEKGVLYVRNFGDGPGMDWRDVFQVDDAAGLEAYCREADIAVTWLPDGKVRTRQVRPAVVSHPITGEKVWFNHGLALHVTSLDPELKDTMIRQYGLEGLPHHTYFGDGTPITDEEMQHIRDAHVAETVSFDWQFGDVVLVENMLAAHGRETFEGERKVVAALADPMTWPEIGLSLTPFMARLAETPGVGPAQAKTDTPKREVSLAAETDLEGSLCRMLAEVLEVDEVDADEDFLDLGGDSIAATRMITRVLERFGVELELDLFFDEGTVEAMAAVVREAHAAS